MRQQDKTLSNEPSSRQVVVKDVSSWTEHIKECPVSHVYVTVSSKVKELPVLASAAQVDGGTPHSTGRQVDGSSKTPFSVQVIAK